MDSINIMNETGKGVKRLRRILRKWTNFILLKYLTERTRTFG